MNLRCEGLFISRFGGFCHGFREGERANTKFLRTRQIMSKHFTVELGLVIFKGVKSSADRDASFTLSTLVHGRIL